ncbi:nucleotide sugar transporter family [Pelomyxa schiedti]|nr:nucleotide sugar transporter family [Pelomyxa schiedti]
MGDDERGRWGATTTGGGTYADPVVDDKMGGNSALANREAPQGEEERALAAAVARQNALASGGGAMTVAVGPTEASPNDGDNKPQDTAAPRDGGEKQARLAPGDYEPGVGASKVAYAAVPQGSTVGAAASAGNKTGSWTGLLVAVVYGTISIAITFFNKAVLSHYDFKWSNTLTLGQMSLAIAFLFTMRAFKLINFPNPTVPTAKTMSPLALFFGGMVVTGLAALRFVNIPIYNTLRRLTTLMVIVGEFVILHKVVPIDEIASVIIMVGGAFVAGYGDLTFTFFGYSLTFLNCLVTAGYLLCIARIKEKTKKNEFEMMLYNNILSLPLILVLVLMFELKEVLNYPYLFDLGFIFCFTMSAVQAFFLNYFIFLCSTMNSPLTTSVTGQIKAIAGSFLGLVILDADVVVTFLLVAGLIVSSGGSIYYGWIKYQQQQARQRQPKSLV